MGTKRNPGKFDCYEKAELDEPMFVLLGRDPLAPQLVRDWVQRGGKSPTGPEQEKMAEALACAAAMDVFREDRVRRQEHEIARENSMKRSMIKMPEVSFCPRCARAHKDLAFVPFQVPPDEFFRALKYWAQCPVTKEPIMLSGDPACDVPDLRVR